MEFPSSDACLEELRHIRIKKANKVKLLAVSMATFYFSKFPDLDRLENTESNKLALKTNQLCPTKVNICKWQLLLLFNLLLTVKEN